MDDAVPASGTHRDEGEPGFRGRLLAPARLWSRPRRIRVFATSAHHPRARRASDLFLLIGAVAGLALVVDAADPPSSFERALEDLFANVPGFLDIVWRVPAHLFFGWALLLLAAALAQRRFSLARDVVVAAALAAYGATVLDDRVLGDLSTDTSVWAQIADLEPPGVAVSLPLAVAFAIGTLCSPHLTRPVRSVGRWLAATGTLGFVVLGATSPTGAVAAALVGAGAAAAVHLVAGSGGGSPSLDDVRTALDDLGVATGELAEAQRQTAGVYQVETTDEDGRALLVKVYGRDARDTQALARAWRTLWYRDAEAGTVTRLQQAEHEAFVTLLAERAGVHVDEVVRAGRSDDGDAVLVLRLVDTGADDPGPGDRVDQMWDAVLAFHRAGLVHGELAPERFRPGPGHVLISGLAGARVVATEDQRNIDLAQLVVSTALVDGAASAAAVAAARLGPDGVAAVLPYLQVAGLGRTLRSDLKTSDVDPDALRTEVAQAAGVDEPAMAKLRRVTKGGLIRAGLLAVVAYFLISSLSGIDFGDLVEQLQGATWGILVIALFMAQTPRFAQAEATRGACPRPLAYGPLVLLQFGISFVNLAIPSTAARVAVNIRFFQRQGIPPAAAVSIGVIDSLGGFVIQLVILASVFLFGAGQVDLDLQRSDDGSNGGLLAVLAIAAALLVVAAIAVVAVPKLRRMATARIGPWLHEVRQTVGSLRSPVKLAQLLGGNLAAEILFAATLGIVALAYGQSIPLGTLLAINVAVSLFAGLMPVPGGIGVAEGALTVGLTAAGVDQATALAIAMSYRLVTYYLPPIWGAFAFHRLERTGFI